MELLSFNPSNVPGDTHQITTEPSVHSHTDRGERTQPDPHCPHCCPPPFSPPLSSFTPLMLRARRRSKGGGQTMEMWLRAHRVSCPPLFSDEVAQFMFALFWLCLPRVVSVTSNGLRSSPPTTVLAAPRYTRGCPSIWDHWIRFPKPHWIPALLARRHCTAQLGAPTPHPPLAAAQMCILPRVAANYLIN